MKFNIVFGFFLSTLFSFIICIIPYIGLLKWVNPILATSLILIPFFLILGGLFCEGFCKVEMAHRGVVLFLGKRRTNVILDEGLNWILPFFETAIQVDIREQIVQIGNDRPFLVMTMPEVANAGSVPNSRVVTQMKVKVSVRYRVRDDIRSIINYLNTKGVEGGIIEMVNSILRQKAALRSDIKLMEEKDRIGEEVEGEIRDENSVHLNTLNSWGIEILGIILGKAMPNSEIMIRGMEQRRINEFKREGDVVDIRNLIDNVKLMAKELKIPELSAADLFQSEIGRATRTIIDGTASERVKQGELIGHMGQQKEANEK